MIKVLIQIPCFNEEHSLPVALAALPRSLPGVDIVEWLVVDDGSTDRTAEVARAHGVDHIVQLPHNQGLARAFMAGLEACLERGADIIVNTDADNQYRAEDIPALLAPILEGSAQMVVGARPIEAIEHFSGIKKRLQRLGSWAVRLASNTNVPDAPSGFRAISREAAMRINVFGDYTYTLETIIQAGRKGIPVTWVPVRTNPDLRPSRLVKSIRNYVLRSMATILLIFMTYRPVQFFALAGALPFSGGLLLGLRWLALFFAGGERAHVPSLVLASVLLMIGVQLWALGLLAHLFATNRKLLEDIQLRDRRAQAAKPSRITDLAA
ncbi:MAG: glycosyltransferase family 2 protein [Alphaproteobacteria bacterium]|nr:glycosyltransferase family 2 protein [Alphaproteobacteria bacterium]MBF0391987.1 glycosyltransferase family 2 protein [Alphaproteobacteria bacterium]